MPEAPPTPGHSAPTWHYRVLVLTALLALGVLSTVAYLTGWRQPQGLITLEASRPGAVVTSPTDGFFAAEALTRGMAVTSSTRVGRMVDVGTTEALAAAEATYRQRVGDWLTLAESLEAEPIRSLRKEADLRAAVLAGEVVAAELELERRATLVERLLIRAPCDGVLMGPVTSGVVAAGEPLARIHRPGPVPVTLRVPVARLAGFMELGGFGVELEELSPGAGSVFGWIDPGSARTFERRQTERGAERWCELSGWLPALPANIVPAGQVLPLGRACAPPPERTRPAPILVTPSNGDTSQEYIVHGVVVPAWRTSVRSLVHGVVAGISAGTGVAIASGQSLVVLESSEASNALARAEALRGASRDRLRAYEAELAATRVRSASAASLASVGGLATNEALVAAFQVDRFAALADAERSAMQEAHALVADAAVYRRRHDLVAPCAGICKRFFVEPGSVVLVGDDVAELCASNLVVRVLLKTPRADEVMLTTSDGSRLVAAPHLPVRTLGPGRWSVAFGLPGDVSLRDGDLLSLRLRKP